MNILLLVTLMIFTATIPMEKENEETACKSYITLLSNYLDYYFGQKNKE